jgi:hypothetical protein
MQQKRKRKNFNKKKIHHSRMDVKFTINGKNFKGTIAISNIL